MNPDFEHISETLYSEPDKTDTNLFGRPSLIPGIEYPLTKKEEHLLDLAWQHFKNLQSRGIE